MAGSSATATGGPAASSQGTGSHFPLDPVDGATLFEAETARRDGLRRKGNLMTGVGEIDDHVLLGGFERGCVVGVSAEEEEMGLLLGLRTIAQLVVTGSGLSAKPKAMIITTLSLSALIPVLKKVITSQVQSRLGSASTADVAATLRRSLEQISISRIFDVEGLWEVLRELDLSQAASPGSHPRSSPPRVVGGVTEPQQAQGRPARRDPGAEVLDSDEEDGLSPPEEPGLAGGLNARHSPSADQRPQGAEQQVHDNEYPTPDIILITHMSSLLKTLFTRRDKDAGHQVLQLLSSHLQYLTRCPEHHGPLVMILNSTTSSPVSASGSVDTPDQGPGSGGNHHGPHSPDDGRALAHQRHGGGKLLDPTLRSIFNPPPLPAASMPSGYYHDTPLARRNKPSFGIVFAQLLDLHLLCTRVPRSQADAETVYAADPGGNVASRYAWVVEVLLDEIGVWADSSQRDGATKASLTVAYPRRHREQRWGVVDMFGDGARLGDAFAPRENRAPGGIRVVGGFGGPKV